MTSAINAIFKHKDLVVPKKWSPPQFARNGSRSPMVVVSVLSGIVATQTQWLELAEKNGTPVVGPTGNSLFASNWVKHVPKKTAQKRTSRGSK